MTSKYIKSFSATLSKETEWERKYKMLQELETKLNEEEFVLSQEDVSCISLILCSQITDLRSTLMKQALNVTVLMCKLFPNSVSPYVHQFTEAIMKQTFVTVKVMTQAADSALCRIMEIEELSVSKLLIEVIKGAQDTHNETLRMRCSLYLVILLKVHNAQIKPHLKSIVKYVITMFRDPNATTRNRARIAYFFIMDVSEEYGQYVYSKADHRVQQLLINMVDKSLDELYESAFEEVGTTPSRTTSRVSSRISSRTTSRTASRGSSPERSLKNNLNDMSRLANKLDALAKKDSSSSPSQKKLVVTPTKPLSRVNNNSKTESPSYMSPTVSSASKVKPRISRKEESTNRRHSDIPIKIAEPKRKVVFRSSSSSSLSEDTFLEDLENELEGLRGLLNRTKLAIERAIEKGYIRKASLELEE